MGIVLQQEAISFLRRGLPGHEVPQQPKEQKPKSWNFDILKVTPSGDLEMMNQVVWICLNEHDNRPIVWGWSLELVSLPSCFFSSSDAGFLARLPQSMLQRFECWNDNRHSRNTFAWTRTTTLNPLSYSGRKPKITLQLITYTVRNYTYIIHCICI